MSINVLVLSGFTGSNPEPFIYGEGKSGLRFSFACSEKVKGEYKSTWFSVTVFGYLADHLKDKLTKGDRIILSGRIGSYESIKDGHKKVHLQITASGVEITKKKETGQREGYEEYKKTISTVKTNSEELPFTDDEIPF